MHHYTMRITHITKDKIDFQDLTFKLKPEPDQPIPSTLVDSISRAGVLHPPVLRKKSDELYQIVSGWQRLRASFETLQLATCCCHILPAETSEAEALAVALEDSLASGALSPVEQAVFFSKIAPLVDESQIIEKFLPIMGLPRRQSLIRQSLELLQLEEHLLAALHAGLLDEKAAHELAAIQFGDRLAIFEIIQLLQLSVSNQKKFIAACHELSRRQHESIIGILSRPELKDILDHPAANIPQKTAKLMAWLDRLLKPNLTGAEDDFSKFMKGLHLPQGATLQHSPSFERDEVTLTVVFRNQDVLTQKWPALRKVLAA